MLNLTENNLRIGVSQALEALSRTGVRFIQQGHADSVTQWMTAFGSTFHHPNVPESETEHEIASENPETVELSLAPPEKPAIVSAIKPLAPKDGQSFWTTAELPIAEREAVLAQQSAIVANCTKCAQLVCSRSRTVYGVGAVTTPIVFVGEGPGAEEDRQGVPFVGAAGQLLDKIIVAMKLQRSEVYIMNAVKCRPQNNRTPTDEEIANCQPYFIKQLETIQPKYIVCLGAVAARALLNTSLGIGKLRGKFYSYGGAQVAVTYHPAYLLRNPDAKKLTWEDMKMVMNAMAT